MPFIISSAHHNIVYYDLLNLLTMISVGNKSTTAKCPFCSVKFDAGRNSQSNFYKHMRRYAEKPEWGRKGHPAADSDVFKQFARRFKEWSGSEQEKKERKAVSQKNWKQERREKLKEKIPELISALRYQVI